MDDIVASRAESPVGPKRLNEMLAALRAHEAELHRLGVAHLSIFGSTVRGEATAESDVDLLIELSPDHAIDIFDLAWIAGELQSVVSTEVDIAVAGHLKPTLAGTITREAVRVF